ncbi:MAG: GH25 family lysozyme [Lachnospiraceae bacterium]
MRQNTTRKQENKGLGAKVLLAIIFFGVIVAAVVWLSLFQFEREGNQNSTENENQTQESQMSSAAENQEDTSFDGDEKESTVEDSSYNLEDEVSSGEDPQNLLEGNMGEQGSSLNLDIEEIRSANEVEESSELSYGIDVSRYQGTIDWSQVANAGVDFAMIRVGYRTIKTGEIIADVNARYNMQEASKYGIQVGVYFFSTAITEAEAIEEANWVANYIASYSITYPVAYNCEGFDKESSRQYGLSSGARSDIAEAFLEQIYKNGYTPMFYAARNELEEDGVWDTAALESRYKIWVAQYPASMGEMIPDYDGNCAMWQYTNQGAVAGISKPVDLNIAYFSYADIADAKNDESMGEVGANVEALMKFTEVEETVTAKQSTNLRDIPSQDTDSTIVYTLQNGETIVRTGVSDSGWSRVLWNGQTLYAVSSYLTTDLSVQVTEPDDGLKTKFADCNDRVTAKIEVNLRTLPSVTRSDSVVVVTLQHGEYVTRTGINTDYGWSRVEYNGQTLYCITSYLTTEAE